MEIKQEKQQVEPKPETAKFFQCLLSASIDGILVTDETQNIIVANEPFCSFFGQVPVNMLETNLLDWLKRVHEDCVRDWTEVDKNAHLKGSCQNIEFKMILPHETRFSVLTHPSWSDCMVKSPAYLACGMTVPVSSWRKIGCE